jgi:hypothetical protein
VLRGVRELIKDIDPDSSLGEHVGEAVGEMLRGLYK